MVGFIGAGFGVRGGSFSVSDGNAKVDVAVSVIIPCHNAEAFLPLQLTGLARQQDAPAFEVLLVDNRNNVDLPGFVEKFSQLTIRVVDATAEAGTGFARNRGIAEARAEKLLFCDADDLVTPTWVRDGAAVLDEVEAFTGGALPMDAAFFGDDADATLAEYERLSAQAGPSNEHRFARGAYPVLLGCSFGARRSLLLRLGGFDRSFGAQGEDNDLAFRLVDALGELPIHREVAIAYRVRSDQEVTLRRAFDAGLKHAYVCARHDAWDVSPAYQGHWAARALLEPVVMAVSRKVQFDLLGRNWGTLTGRVVVRAKGVPAPRFGDMVGDRPTRWWNTPTS